MVQRFAAKDGRTVVEDLIDSIKANRSYLSEIDGAIGDGDHGINMAKGFSLTAERLADGMSLSECFGTLATILITEIGGAMGPLYGMLFRGLAKGCEGYESIDALVFGRMLEEAQSNMQKISQAQEGDKTLMDAWIPAVISYLSAVRAGKGFSECLQAMATAAEVGRDQTKDIVAKVGRASRLGERSRGTLDAGATSCALLLRTMADSFGRLLVKTE